MSTTNEYPQFLEIDAGRPVHAMAFAANSRCLVVGSEKDIRLWRVKDGKATTMKAHGVRCVAASNDGHWIAAGTRNGNMFVWDATTGKPVFTSDENALDVDFSPDSTRLVVADGRNGTATIWDIATRRGTRILHHESVVLVAKYSPQGDQIATVTENFVRIWDSSDSRLLARVEVGGHDLLWASNHLLIQTKDSVIKQISAVTRSTVFEWSDLSVAGAHLCIALPLQHGRFVACVADRTIILLDTITHTQLSSIQHTDNICSIACSSNGLLLAIADERKIIIKDISSVISRLVSDPQLDIYNIALDEWKRGQLTNAEALLSAAIPTSGKPHHVLASRALVRAHLGHWDDALVDANESIGMHRSLVGYIAKCMALIGMGEKDKGIRVYDIAFYHFHSERVALLLLIKAVVLFMAGERVDAISRIDDLITDACADPTFYVVQAYAHLLLGDKHVESGNYEHAIQSFEDARIKLGNSTHQPPLIVSLISGWRFKDLSITIQQRLCEALFTADRTKEAGESVLRMVDQKFPLIEPIKTWLPNFKCRCRHKLEELGDNAANAQRYDEAISQYTAALSLDPVASQDLLMKRSNVWAGKGVRQNALNDAKEWVRLVLMSGSWKDALAAATGFMLGESTIYRAVCVHLKMTGRVTDATACFRQVSNQLAQGRNGEHVNRTRDFKSSCRVQLHDLEDSAMNTKQYDETVWVALSPDPASSQRPAAKPSKTYAERGAQRGALNDANEPVSPSASRKHSALLDTNRHDDTIGTFEKMLSEMSESSDPVIRERYRLYVRTKRAIRRSIRNAIRHSPPVLIDVLSGRLCKKAEQAAAFKATPAFTTLVTSMTTHIDHTRIKQVVKEFYRYAAFSHTWEDNEPSYEKVVKIVVYDLEASPTHNKLQMFCKIARDEGFNWAWSDTCCINKGDHIVLQEALVSMFKWYEGSAMTIIFLCDVGRLAVLGALMRSRWNSRGWTLQEYHASKVVRFYTKDWTPYLGLTIYNHKDSPEIISEMEHVTGISAQALVALRPGLSDIREKLRLASTRRTTRVEDAAYSLLGIFSMTLPVTYGERDKALGRLLSQLLMSSGNTSILAWTGKPNSFNSCLPANIVVFSQPLTSHTPPAIVDAEMGTVTAELRASSLDSDLVTRLYDQLDGLSTPAFVGQRMRLPCLVFKITAVSPKEGSDSVFQAQVDVLGAVEIKAGHNLERLDSLCLVHPWIDFLLDRHATENIEIPPDDSEEDETSEEDEYPARAFYMGHIGCVIAGSPPSPSAPLLTDTLAEFLARLRKPFGALLLAPTRRNMQEYRRIATENLISVQVEEITSATLHRLIRGVRVLDVL